MEKSPDQHHPAQDVSFVAADRILARAAALDSGREEMMPVQRLQAVAAEAGITPDAVAAALREHAREATTAFGYIDRASATGRFSHVRCDDGNGPDRTSDPRLRELACGLRPRPSRAPRRRRAVLSRVPTRRRSKVRVRRS
jgi:hypothetical protein